MPSSKAQDGNIQVKKDFTDERKNTQIPVVKNWAFIPIDRRLDYLVNPPAEEHNEILHALRRGIIEGVVSDSNFIIRRAGRAYRRKPELAKDHIYTQLMEAQKETGPRQTKLDFTGHFAKPKVPKARAANDAVINAGSNKSTGVIKSKEIKAEDADGNTLYEGI